MPLFHNKKENDAMKKISLFTMMLLLVCSLAFAMAKKPDANTYAGCMQRPYTECSAFGDPWNPNFPYSVASQSNVTGVVYLKDANGNLIPNPKYDPNKKTYDPVAFFKCAEPIYAQCKAKFGK